MAMSRRGLRDAVVGSLLLLAVLALVNYLAQRYPWRWDATAAQLHTLSGQTLRLLASLRQDVRITAFYDDDHPGRPKAQGLLEAYAYHAPTLRWELVDPVREVTRARHYRVTEQGTLVVESRGRLARLDGLADLGPSEEQLTNALIRVTRVEARRACVVEGHGEKSWQDTSAKGLWAFQRALGEEGYEVNRLVPLAHPHDAGCSVLVIAAPTSELANAEQQALDDYLARGGRALILLSAGPPLGLHAALSRWGVRVGEAVILDPLAAVFGADPTAPVITTYGAHESVKDFRLLSFFPWTRPVGATERPPAGIQVSPLVWSSPQSWARPYRQGVRPEEISRDFVAGTDQKGPLTLGVAVEADKARLIVLGTGEIAANQYFLLFGHKNLLLNVMAWLATEPGLIAVKPRTAGGQVILLSARQGKAIFYSLVVSYPLLVFAAGLGVWGWRRFR